MQNTLVNRSQHTSFMLFSLDFFGCRSQWHLPFRLAQNSARRALSPPCLLPLALSAPRCPPRLGSPRRFRQGRCRALCAPCLSLWVLSFAVGPPARRFRLWLNFPRSVRSGGARSCSLRSHSFSPFRPPALRASITQKQGRQSYARPQAVFDCLFFLCDKTQLSQSSTRVLTHLCKLD